MINTVNEVAQIINDFGHKKDNLIIAIDGRCASGKSTLAQELAELFDANVFHMDDFFLRPEQRTEGRIKIAGENVDHERFLEEVLLPLKSGKDFSYRPFSCSKMCLMEPTKVENKRINIVEGSYSCHKDLIEYYDLKIFLTVDVDEQMRRIVARNGETSAKVFKEKWIPLEEKYFEEFDVENKCEYVFR